MIETITHYSYRTSDGRQFSDKAGAEMHEFSLTMPAVWMVIGHSRIINENLVFSTEDGATDYISAHYPEAFDVEAVRLVIDYQLHIRNQL